MRQSCSGDNASHAVPDKIEDDLFLLEMFGNLAFNLLGESEAHDADISISVQFVGRWD